MQIERIRIKMERKKERALFLYKKDSPFEHKVERFRKKYNRKQKYRDSWE